MIDPSLPQCQPDPCLTDPTRPDCRGEVRDDTRTNFARRVNTGLVLGGLRLGFGSAPAPVIPLPPVIPPPVVVVPPTPARPICDLVELNPIYFDFGTATLSPRSRALLAENVELLMNNPECCVFVDGFIDNTEADRFGMPLGGRRAQAVYDYYLSRGVAASKIQVRNRGASSPNCDKEDPGIGCERNRRVESVPVDCERFRMMLN